jgi:hypothetical protein
MAIANSPGTTGVADQAGVRRSDPKVDVSGLLIERQSVSRLTGIVV